MKKIEDNSVDLIITDPPYGTIKNLELDGWENKGKNEWDTVIDTKKLFDEYARVLRDNGRIILFSQEPYTSLLRTYNQTYGIEFNYPMLWRKNVHANLFMAKKAPLNYFEDINVYTKKYGKNTFKELREYFKKLQEYINLNLKEINKVMGSRRAEHTFYWNSYQFKLCTKATYNELTKRFKLNEWEDFKTYEELKEYDYERTFNLPKGTKYVPNILEYNKEKERYHPTQKPVAMLEYLINIYSNENETVLDSCIGSGSTAIAAINTNRNYIGFELDEKYYELANERIAKHTKQMELFTF
ncbi:site-specific DNA-methyltransferase [Staphylococcus haemolyticus]|nr:site-specific DNA-methyltransferase [Staphylococcus haemolyticus]